VAFRYVLNIGAFRLNQGVTYYKFHYAVTCGRVPDEGLFPPSLPLGLLLQGRGRSTIPPQVLVPGSLAYAM
jgi:hypothetical protein